jgi:hypothetical protein
MSPTTTRSLARVSSTLALAALVAACGAAGDSGAQDPAAEAVRTPVVTRLAEGFRLKHHHLHEDGSPDAVHLYGGDTAGSGSDEWQEFPADPFTAELVPVAATNVWTVEVIPGELFAYGLRREGTDRAFRVEFDLTQSVPTPPAPWGASR